MIEGTSTVHDWLGNLLSTFRSAWADQAKGHALGLSNLEDFSPPCQVYLFWFRLEPDIDYCRLVRMALTGRPDGESEVIGPMQPADALGVLTEVLRWERWSENVEDSMYLPLDESDSSARMHLAHTLREAQRELDRYLVLRARGMDTVAHIGNRMGSPGGFIWDVYGDPRSLEPASLIAEEWLLSTRQRNRPLPREPQPERIPAQGAHIYPHVCVGELPLQTPEEVLQGSGRRPWIIYEKAFDTQYQGRRVIVRRDGFIPIESGSAEEANSDLNHIMAAALLSGLDTTAVRLGEVGNAMIDPVALSIVSWGTQVVFMRTASLSHGLDVEDMIFRERVDIDILRQVISNAEAVSSDSYLCSVMSFLLEAHTHQESQEYRQSFVMSWLIIESWLDKTWSDALNEKNVSKTRQERLSEGNRFTAAVKSEVLNLLGHIDRDQLSKITTLRKRRNEAVHEGYDPVQSESQEALEFAMELCSAQFQAAIALRRQAACPSNRVGEAGSDGGI